MKKKLRSNQEVILVNVVMWPFFNYLQLNGAYRQVVIGILMACLIDTAAAS